MISDQFPFDEIIRFGDPWHGLWRLSTGQIETPHGVSVAMIGNLPGQGAWGDGSAMIVKIPGLPAPVNDAADIAAGRTWLDYAILSGDTQRLYGIDFSRIYIDPTNKPWRVDLSPWAENTGTAGTFHVNLTLSTFGNIGGTAVTQVFGEQTAAFTLLPGVQNILSCSLEDIGADCRRFLLAVVDTKADGQRFARAIYELVIAGTPPAATFSLTEVANEVAAHIDNPAATFNHSAVGKRVEQTANGWNVYSVVSNNGVVDWGIYNPNPANSWTWCTTSFSQTKIYKVLIGARYAQNAIQIMEQRTDVSFSLTGSYDVTSPSPRIDDASTTGTLTVTARILANAVPILSETLTVTETKHQINSAVTNTLTIDYNGAFESFNDIPTSWPIGQYDYESSRDWPSISHNQWSWLARRYGNACYGLYVRAPKIMTDTATKPLLFHQVVGKIGASATTLQSADFLNGPRFASENPVTGQVFRDTSPVCWV